MPPSPESSSPSDAGGPVVCWAASCPARLSSAAAQAHVFVALCMMLSPGRNQRGLGSSKFRSRRCQQRSHARGLRDARWKHATLYGAGLFLRPLCLVRAGFLGQLALNADCMHRRRGRASRASLHTIQTAPQIHPMQTISQGSFIFLTMKQCLWAQSRDSRHLNRAPKL